MGAGDPLPEADQRVPGMLAHAREVDRADPVGDPARQPRYWRWTPAVAAPCFSWPVSFRARSPGRAGGRSGGLPSPGPATENRRTTPHMAKVSHEAQLRSRCVRSGARSPTCSTIVQPSRLGRPLASVLTYLPACSHGSGRAKHDLSRHSSSLRFRAPRRVPNPGSRSRLRFCCRHTRVIARRLHPSETRSPRQPGSPQVTPLAAPRPGGRYTPGMADIGGSWAVTTLAERPELLDAAIGLGMLDETAAFMSRNLVGLITSPSRFRDLWPELAVIVLDASGAVIARAFAVSYATSGGHARAELPDHGWEAVLIWAAEDKLDGCIPDTAAAVTVTVASDWRGQGVSTVALRALAQAASEVGLRRLICPVRPACKALEPAVPMNEYVARTREDGLPADPGYARTSGQAELSAALLPLQ